MALATTRSKKFALEALKKRRAANKKQKKVDNSSLYAGSPVYYYCVSCGGLADVLSECHIYSPKNLCDECQALKDMNWLK